MLWYCTFNDMVALCYSIVMLILFANVLLCIIMLDIICKIICYGIFIMFAFCYAMFIFPYNMFMISMNCVCFVMTC